MNEIAIHLVVATATIASFSVATFTVECVVVIAIALV